MIDALTMDFKIEFAERLYNAMTARNISQSALARRCGANRAWINRILNGKENLTLESIAKLSVALEYNLIYMSKLDTIEITMEANRWETTMNGRSRSLNF